MDYKKELSVYLDGLKDSCLRVFDYQEETMADYDVNVERLIATERVERTLNMAYGALQFAMEASIISFHDYDVMRRKQKDIYKRLLERVNKW